MSMSRVVNSLEELWSFPAMVSEYSNELLVAVVILGEVKEETNEFEVSVEVFETE